MFDQISLRAIEITENKRIRWLQGRRLVAVQIAAACVCLALITFCAFQLQVNLTTVSFSNLIVVFCMAYYGGFWRASVVSVLAVASLDYFFTQPLFEFRMSDPRDWAALATFEVSALVIARLSAKETRSAREALVNRVAMEQLYELSRSSLLLDLHQPPGAQLAVLIQRIFRAEAVAIFDLGRGREDTAGDWGTDDPSIARQAFLDQTALDDPRTRTAARVLKINSRSIGALAVRGNITPLEMDALASLAELTIERCASLENEERAERVRQAEELRTAVLDSLAHEFKTPLASIKTAASGLQEFGKLTGTQSELASLIDQQASRLSSLCAKLLSTAKLEEQAVLVSRSRLNVYSFLVELLEEEPNRRHKHRVRIEVEEPGLAICADRALLSMVLTQYIDNAGKYSTPGTQIEITAHKGMNEAVFSVHNYGPLIPLEDRERVFDRFYRSPRQAGQVPGTGIGLSVAKKAAAAHHTHVWVVSSATEGTTFYLSIPETRESL